MSNPEGAACANCGAALAGRYCHRCGQEAVERRMPLRSLLGDALGDLFAFDSRLVRTLRPLLLRPGRLTAEWCRGRRVRYVPPLRLYVFDAALSFLVMAATDVPLVRVSADAEPAARQRDAPRDARVPEVLQRSGVAVIAAWQRHPEGFQDLLLDRMGRLSLLLAPVSALLLAALYRNRRRYLVEHLVFTLHVHAFAFLAVSLALLLTAAVGARRLSGVAVAVVVVAYLFLALRRVYGGRAWATAARTLAFGFLYLGVVYLPTLVLALAWTVWTA